jgi:hypothetical protein
LLDLDDGLFVKLFERIVIRWMKIFGHSYREATKGVYMDEHERDDVVAYRGQFLAKMAKHEKWMPTFTDDCSDIIWPNLQNGEKSLIFVTHDESIFHAFDGQGRQWLLAGEQPLRKKGVGLVLHVSDFLTDVCGRLTLMDDDVVTNDECAKEAYEIMKPGKNYDDWWTIEDLAKQVVEKVVPIFERRFSNAQALFAFDNATSHIVFAADALQAKHMNLGHDSKQPQMRPMTYGNGIVQEMCFPFAHPPLLYGELKGLKIVLEEPGLWQPGLRLECTDQKNNLCKDGKACCARNVMASQPDFKAQHYLLEELLAECGHLSIFYPKFHCKLNYIENFWAAVKRRTRDNCDYTFPRLCNAIPHALANVPIVEICRYA